MIRQVAHFFTKELALTNVQVQLITNDRLNGLAAKKEGLEVSSINQYSEEANKRFPGVLDLLGPQAVESEKKNKGSALFEKHLSVTDAQRRVKQKELWSGKFKNRNKDYASVLVEWTPGEMRRVDIDSFEDKNRAFDGDRVALEVVQQGDVLKGKVKSILVRNWRSYAGTISEVEAQSVVKRTGKVTVFPVDKSIPAIWIETRQMDALKEQRIVVAVDSWDRFSPRPSGHYVKALGVCI